MALGCHHIKKCGNYYRAANPDGDNKSAINVYLDTLNVLNHTRNFPEKADIIDLVEFVNDMYFSQAIKWICDVCGYDYYENSYNKEKNIDPCLAILDEIEPKDGNYEDVPFRKLDDGVLNEYIQYPHIWFYEEGISLHVQKLFEIGYSVRDNCITIPVRDELGNLVGVKGRTTLDHEKLGVSKYWYPYPVPKTKILYGLDKSYPYIKDMGEVIVFEGEKSVMKAFSYGFCNCVSIGGHELSSTQILKLEKLGVNIVLAFDKNVTSKEIRKEASKFLMKDRIYTIFEQNNVGLLGEKEAPVDKGLDSFVRLYTTDKHKIYK